VWGFCGHWCGHWQVSLRDFLTTSSSNPLQRVYVHSCPDFQDCSTDVAEEIALVEVFLGKSGQTVKLTPVHDCNIALMLVDTLLSHHVTEVVIKPLIGEMPRSSDGCLMSTDKPPTILAYTLPCPRRRNGETLSLFQPRRADKLKHKYVTSHQERKTKNMSHLFSQVRLFDGTPTYGMKIRARPRTSRGCIAQPYSELRDTTYCSLFVVDATW
jgi:hypothetical protein